MSIAPRSKSHLCARIRTAGLALGVVGLLAAGSSASAKAPYKNPYPTHNALFQGAGAAAGHIQYAPAELALERFRIDYTDKHDTAIRDLGVEMVGDGAVRAWLSDDDGRSPLTLRAKWRNVKASPSVEFIHLIAKCQRKVDCSIGSLPRDPDKVALLAGFSFHNLSGARKIERVAIWPRRVTGPNAHTTYFATLDGEGPTRYSVDIYLVLVDRSIVAGEYDASASSQPNTPYAAVPLEWKYGFLALQGFDVKFKNGPHHLQEFAIGQIPSNNGLSAVYFSDKNDDDPIWAKLWWADLEPPSKKVIPLDKPLPGAKPGYDGPAPELDPSVKGGSKLPTTKHKPQPKQPKLPSGPLPTGPIGK